GGALRETPKRRARKVKPGWQARSWRQGWEATAAGPQKYGEWSQGPGASQGARYPWRPRWSPSPAPTRPGPRALLGVGFGALPPGRFRRRSSRPTPFARPAASDTP